MAAIHFLLVDDEKILVETIAERLRLKGFAVDISLSGKDALNWLATCHTIDIVVLDIQMPGEDGIGTLKQIKDNHPLVEVVMLTGHATIQTAIDAIKHGAFDYLIKPCDLDALLAKASTAVTRKRRREAKINTAKLTPYISDREREELISKIMEE